MIFYYYESNINFARDVAELKFGMDISLDVEKPLTSETSISHPVVWEKSNNSAVKKFSTVHMCTIFSIERLISLILYQFHICIYCANMQR